MKFIAKSSSEADFNAWVKTVKQSHPLDYSEAAQPSEYAPAAFYSLPDEGLFNQIVMKYMVP
jgi:cytochrome o ubiquinol oxidase subunit 2